MAELHAKSATELEQLIAAAMAMEAGTGDNFTFSSGVAEDTETHAHGQWVLPAAANAQLKNAQKDVHEKTLTVEIDHQVRVPHGAPHVLHSLTFRCKQT